MNAPARSALGSGAIALLPCSVDDLVDRVVERLAEHTQEPDVDRLLDREELAARLGISTRSLDTLRRKKGFPEVAVLEAPRFEWKVVLEFLKGGAGT